MSQVYFGTVQATTLSLTNTQIVVKSPSMAPGLYNLIIPTGSMGNAQWDFYCYLKLSEINFFKFFKRTTVVMEYRLYVSSFTPNTGSINGGTTVSVYGEGFR